MCMCTNALPCLAELENMHANLRNFMAKYCYCIWLHATSFNSHITNFFAYKNLTFSGFYFPGGHVHQAYTSPRLTGIVKGQRESSISIALHITLSAIITDAC